MGRSLNLLRKVVLFCLAGEPVKNQEVSGGAVDKCGNCG